MTRNLEPPFLEPRISCFCQCNVIVSIYDKTGRAYLEDLRSGASLKSRTQHCDTAPLQNINLMRDTESPKVLLPRSRVLTHCLSSAQSQQGRFIRYCLVENEI